VHEFEFEFEFELGSVFVGKNISSDYPGGLFTG
jgi:hypothetical protein